MSTRTRPDGTDFLALTRQARTAVTFVQVARGAVFERSQLVLEDLEPTTIWLNHQDGDRLGHMATGTFLDLWWHPESGLGVAGLRGVLGRADPCAQLFEDAELWLWAPRISGSGLRYDAELRNGAMPGTVGACVLFLGAGGDLSRTSGD